MINIEVKMEHPDGVFGRFLTIQLISTPTMDDHGYRSWTEVNRYLAELWYNPEHARGEGGYGRGVLASAEFDHLYGHDVLTIVAEAIEALGGKKMGNEGR